MFAPLQAKQEEALAALSAEKAAADAATAAAEGTIAEREAAIGALQEEVAGLKENLEALQTQLGERWLLILAAELAFLSSAAACVYAFLPAGMQHREA